MDLVEYLLFCFIYGCFSFNVILFWILIRFLYEQDMVCWGLFVSEGIIHEVYEIEWMLGYYSWVIDVEMLSGYVGGEVVSTVLECDQSSKFKDRI